MTSQPSLKRKQLLDIGLTFGRQIAILGIGLATLPLLAWVLGPEGVGAWALLASALSISLTLGSGGISSAYLFFVGRSQIGKESVPGVVWQQILIGGIVSLLCLILATPFLFRSDILSEIQLETIYYLILCLAITFLQIPAVAFARIERKFGLIAVFDIAARVAMFATLLAFYFLEIQSLRWLLFSTLAINLSIMLGWWIQAWSRPKPTTDETISIKQVRFREMFAYAWKSAGANAVAQLNYRADVFLLSAWSTPLQLGFYGIAVMIAEKAWMVSKSVGEVSFSYLTQSDASPENMIQSALVTAKWTGLATLAICIAICSLGPFLPMILGSRFDGCATPLLFLAPGILALGISRILSNALATLGRPGLNFWFGMIGFTANLVINALLIPKHGAIGAAIATSISYSILLSLRFIALKFLGFPLTPFYTVSAAEITDIKSIVNKRFKMANATQP